MYIHTYRNIYQSVQSLTCVRLFVTPWTAARQASLSITNSQSLFKLMSIESVMPSNHLIFCCPLVLLPSIFPRKHIYICVYVCIYTHMHIQGKKGELFPGLDFYEGLLYTGLPLDATGYLNHMLQLHRESTVLNGKR